MTSYLDGGHLGVTPPAEVAELQRAVAEPDRAAVQRGSLLDLKLQVMEVREVMIRARSAHTMEAARHYGKLSVLSCFLSIGGSSNTTQHNNSRSYGFYFGAITFFNRIFYIML